jgi:hypothetical protein
MSPILTILISALALAGVSATAAHAYRAGLYTFHAAQIGACSLLDWQIDVEPDGDIFGAVGFDGRRARVEGSIQNDGTFQLTGHERASGRPVTIKGAAAGDRLTMTIVGSDGPCDEQTIKLDPAIR